MYASKACRMRALRYRRATAELVPMDEQVAAVRVPVSSKPVTEQVERAVLEARAVGFALQRLGTVASPGLAWRCTRLGQAIITALRDTFGDAAL